MILSPNERQITISLHDKPKCSCELAEDLNKGNTVIATNLRKMQESKLVKHVRTGIRKKYRLTNYGESIYKLLSDHDTSFNDLIVEYNGKKRDDGKCNK